MNAQRDVTIEEASVPLVTDNQSDGEDDLFIGLRVMRSGFGPICWTLRNTANAIQKQEGWPDRVRSKFLQSLCEAACSGDLVMCDPYTGLDQKHGLVVDNVNTVTPVAVNDWLNRQGAPYRWKDASIESTVDSEKLVCGAESASPKSDDPSIAGIPIEVDRKEVATQTKGTGAIPYANKKAMIAQHVNKWPSICADMTDASKNGLSEAAKAGSRGWYEDKALEWARLKNKLIQPNASATLTNGMNRLTGVKHRLED